MTKRMIESGIEWIGNIPSDWKISKIKQIGQYINGYAFKPEDWSDKGKRIIRIQDLTGSNDSPNHYVGELPSKYLIKKGDILISWAATLDAFVWEKEDDGWLNQHIFKAIPDEKKIDFTFFYWLMKITMDNMNNDNKHGIVMQHVTLGVFGNFSVPLPPMVEQKKISNFLNIKCGDIDESISETKAIIEDYKKYKQSLITETVTRGLHSDIEPKGCKLDWIDEIPKNWSITRLKYLFTFGKGLPITKENLIETGVPVISYGQIHAKDNPGTRIISSLYRYVSPDYLNTNVSSLVENGDFLVADTSEDLDGCGDCVYVDTVDTLFAGYHTIILKSIHNRDNRYLAYLFKTDAWRSQIRKQVFGIKVYSITQSILRTLTVILPPESEQEEIVNYLDAKCTEIDKLIAAKEALIEDLEVYKKSLIYEYVTGKKEVI